MENIIDNIRIELRKNTDEKTHATSHRENAKGYEKQGNGEVDVI